MRVARAHSSSIRMISNARSSPGAPGLEQFVRLLVLLSADDGRLDGFLLTADRVCEQRIDTLVIGLVAGDRAEAGDGGRIILLLEAFLFHR